MSDNYISDYWDWLSSIDSRLRDILVALDDENCTGRVGSRQNFNGDFECRLYKVATDSEDFVKLYVQSAELAIKRGEVKEYAIESEALKWWNVIAFMRNDVMKEAAAYLAKDLS